MKTKTVLTALVLRALTAVSQDSLYFNDGRTVAALVYELDGGYVRFKPYDNPEAPVDRVSTNDIWKIRYHSGYIKLFRMTSEPREIRVQSADPALPAGVVQQKTSYAGPRLGVTIVGDGTLAQQLYDANKSPVLSQFGWQFETRFFKTTNGISGLFEFVPLIAGMEQGLFLPSASALVGMRFERGDCVEFGVGPNFSISGVGLVMAAGTSFHVGEVYFPVNLAFVPSVGQIRDGVATQTGMRITMTVGFNIRKR